MPGDDQKICVACGNSCAGQARTKDSRGKYYHQECYEKAKAAHKRKLREQQQAASNAFASPPASSSSSEPDDEGDIMSMLLDDPGASPAAPPVIAAGATCPSCGHSIASGAILCINCGTNLQSGGSAKTTAVRKPKRGSSDDDPGWSAFDKIARVILVICVIVYAGLFAASMIQPGGLTFIFYLALFPFLFLWTIFVCVAAFRTSILQGLLTLLVPFYFLVFIVLFHRDRTLRLASLVWLVSVGMAGISTYVYMKSDAYYARGSTERRPAPTSAAAPSGPKFGSPDGAN